MCFSLEPQHEGLNQQKCGRDFVWAQEWRIGGCMQSVIFTRPVKYMEYMRLDYLDMVAISFTLL
jgi:hypothetical protein